MTPPDLEKLLMMTAIVAGGCFAGTLFTKMIFAALRAGMHHVAMGG